MLTYLTLILLCQLFGEVFVKLLELPFPGPVVGMAVLFVGLLIKGSLPEGLGKASDGLLSNLSLMFVPAGVGIMVNADLIYRELVPISVALVVSTLIAIAVTGLIMSFLTRNKAIGEFKERND